MNEILSQIMSAIIAAQFLFVYSKMRFLIQKLPSSNIPDLWFGYSPQDLDNIYELWGPTGRQRYTSVAHFDMMAFIPSYASLLGYMCYYVIEDWSLILWWIALIAWCDYVETFILMITCSAYPHGDVQHMELLIQISSYANMAKWILVAAIIGFSIYSTMQKKNTVEKDKKE